MAIVLFDVNAKNKQTIKERFEKQLAIIWQELGLPTDSLADYLATGGDWQIGKTIHPLQIKTITIYLFGCLCGNNTILSDFTYQSSSAPR